MKTRDRRSWPLATQVLESLTAYRDESERGEGCVLLQQPASELGEAMKLEYWIRQGGLDAENLGDFLGPYLEHSQHIHHPGSIGHQVAVPHEGAALLT